MNYSKKSKSMSIPSAKKAKGMNPRALWKKSIKEAMQGHKKKNMGVGAHSIPKPKKYQVNDWKLIDKRIKQLLQKKNFKDSRNIEEIQDLINKYVYGRQELELDGFAGEYTSKGIKEYKFVRKYWSKRAKLRIDPLITYKLYKKRSMYV